MRVTLVILDESEKEIARVHFPNHQLFMQINWLVTLPNKYVIEWEEE